MSIANRRGTRIAAPAVFPGIDSAIEVRDTTPSHSLSAIFPVSGKYENGLPVGSVCMVGADVKNVVELGFWATMTGAIEVLPMLIPTRSARANNASSPINTPVVVPRVWWAAGKEHRQTGSQM